MTAKITSVFFRVTRPLFAALIGLSIAQTMAAPRDVSPQTNLPSVTIHIPAA